MSSATSIEKDFRLKPEAAKNKGGRRRNGADPKGDRGFRVEPEDAPDNGFKAWHFFVLASLMMATVAVVLSRQSTPEHLILISFTIGAAGAAAAGFYRMLAPLATEDAAMFSEPLTERSRAALEREKALVMRSIKELEFDRAMGKLSPRDFDEMAGRLRTRAISLMKQLDEGGSVYREIIERELSARLGKGAAFAPPTESSAEAAAPRTAGADARPARDAAGACASCGTSNDHDAAFCKRCGSKLTGVR